jgi:putative membrane protein
MQIESGKYYEVGRKALWYYIIQKSYTSIVFFIIGALLSIAGAVTPGSIGLALTAIGLAIVGLAILIEIIAAVIAKLEYATTRVMLDDSSLRIVEGIFNKEETALPFRRIQSVEIKQDIVHRMFGVGHVVISTTTDLEQPGKTVSEADEEVIPVMEYELAKAVAEVLTSRAEVERMQVEGGGSNTETRK